jgi:ADP-ribose pyrophosphatase
MPQRKSVSRKPARRARSAKPRRRQKQVEVLSSKTVFKGRVFSVISDRVKEPNGIVATRDVVRHSGSVVVLAVDETGPEPRVLLEQQYRYAVAQYLWELPAGSIDQGETALAAGKRELKEETGYRAKHWKHALFFYPSPGFINETMTVYLARGLTPGKAHPEEDEAIACTLIPLSRAIGMALSGRIRDGKTIASVLWLARFLAQAG